MEHEHKKNKLGIVPGVYIPVCLNIFSILMFLRFGLIIGQVGFLGILLLLVISYSIDFVTVLSLSAIASNGEVKGGGAYYLISRSLGPEFGGSIGLLFYLAQVLNTALNVVGLIDCIKFNAGSALPDGYWWGYLFQTGGLLLCTCLCLAGSGLFAKAGNALFVVMYIAIFSVALSAFVKAPFEDPGLGIHFTGASWETLFGNMVPRQNSASYKGFSTFRDLFGILFPATSGIFAGASMSGDLKSPSKAIPKGTLWAMLSTFIGYFIVVIGLACSITQESFLADPNVIQNTSLWSPIILGGEFAAGFFSAVMGVVGSAKLMQALARDRLFPGLSLFGQGTKSGDEPIFAIFLTFAIAQVAMLANLNQIATFISMGYQMTFFVMNLACFTLKIGSAPNFRPAFKFFSWQSAFAGSILSAAAMFFIDQTYAATAVCCLIALFLLIHYLSPPKKWGDVSQNLIYHQVRKYLLRLRPEHIKFWRPQIILLINNPKRQTRLIQFCNSMKKGSLYILGHVIVTDDFTAGVQEAKKQHDAWHEYINAFSRIKAFVQLNMSPSLVWGVRNVILSAGLGGMRPNIAVLGFYNMNELRNKSPHLNIPASPSVFRQPLNQRKTRKRGDTSARIMHMPLPTDQNKAEEMVPVTQYVEMLEDLALRFRLNVAVAMGFTDLETPRTDGSNTKKYIDLWPVQMSAEILSDGKNIVTTNFDTYTLILQLGFILRSVPAWKKAFKLRVMVFVEYESEVVEEQARVKALLEKLRIDATIKVFWLACGDLLTYESIINGNCEDEETERVVTQCLKDEEWWDELQEFRGKTPAEATSKDLISLAQALEASSGWGGVGIQHHAFDKDHPTRRFSVADMMELPRKPTVSRLSRLGVNVGIHTQNLPQDVFNDELSSDSDLSDEEAAALADASYDVDFNESDDEGSDNDAYEADERRPLLVIPPRRTSVADELVRRPTLVQRAAERLLKKAEESDATAVNYGSTSSTTPSQEITKPILKLDLSAAPILSKSPAREPSSLMSPPPKRPSLSRTTSGVKFSSRPTPDMQIGEEGTGGPSIYFKDTQMSQPTSTSQMPRRPGLSRQGSTSGPVDGSTTPRRPVLSRQTSASAGKFTSRPLPDTQISVEDPSGGPSISFKTRGIAPEAPTPPKRPGLSRHSSAGGEAITSPTKRPSLSRHGSSTAKFSSRQLPETRVTTTDGAQPTISFVEPTQSSRPDSRPGSRAHSRKNSGYQKFTPMGGNGMDASSGGVTVPDMLASYQFDKTTNSGGASTPTAAAKLAVSKDGGDNGSIRSGLSSASGGSAYSTQSMPLSFNDLPSRAQHLILNELMKRESGEEAAVLFTTLPIPEEGTSANEGASIRYLSDIEVLCYELPPVLLVLSNNMTVTVSL